MPVSASRLAGGNMNQQAIKQLLDRWMNDPKFRSEVRQDPAGAVKKTGIQLGAEEQAAFQKVDWSLSDEQLKARISKLP
ncbi:MAG: hypothetical protein HY552_02265 [Elusimicrobia bacterium]|nr:hypothetical protein [Elusimicrobiota bacterium]